MLAVAAVASLFAVGPVQRGFILGSGVTIALGAAVALVVLVSGTAPLMMGELAEQWTAQALRPLTRHGWKLVNHFGLGFGDQDHVLVGPGGVVLVETKWGATPWDLDDRDYFFQSAVAQTARNAQQLQRWQPVAGQGAKVEPILVLWGQARRKLADVPPRRHRSGVVVMSGDQLQEWALRLGRERLSSEQVDAIWSDIDRHVEKRDAHELRTRPMPRSMVELAQSVCGCIGAAALGFLVAAQALAKLGSLILWCISGGILLLAGELLRRRTRWRWQSGMFQVGLLSTYVIGAVAVAHAYLSR
jgi:hypothetical protein